jgi:hypothetical protein
MEESSRENKKKELDWWEGLEDVARNVGRM